MFFIVFYNKKNIVKGLFKNLRVKAKKAKRHNTVEKNDTHESSVNYEKKLGCLTKKRVSKTFDITRKNY